MRSIWIWSAVFLSTLSLRRATLFSAHAAPQSLYFYPRSPCGERPSDIVTIKQEATISIHALLAESDGRYRRCHHYARNFYPRSPCGERLVGHCDGVWYVVFLSTLSLRRATGTDCAGVPAAGFLSTLSLRRATRSHNIHVCLHDIFLSTLSLRRATCGWWITRAMKAFLSTLSLRRATKGSGKSTTLTNFYPRSPCGERPRNLKSVAATPSISIHALLAESDPQRQSLPKSHYRFLSTLSLRRATPVRHQAPRKSWISIHALLAESDLGSP